MRERGEKRGKKKRKKQERKKEILLEEEPVCGLFFYIKRIKRSVVSNF